MSIETTTPDATATPLSQVERMLRKDFKNHDGWRNHPFVLLARKFANELMAAKAELARLQELNSRCAKDGIGHAHRAERAEAAFNKLSEDSQPLYAEINALRAARDDALIAVDSWVAECKELRAEVGRLKERERNCQTLQEAEARAIIRALQEITGNPYASCAETVTFVNQLRTQLAELEKDKARLDWLAEQIGPGYAGGIVTVANLIPTFGGSLRAAIDAARAGKETT